MNRVQVYSAAAADFTDWSGTAMTFVGDLKEAIGRFLRTVPATGGKAHEATQQMCLPLRVVDQEIER